MTPVDDIVKGLSDGNLLIDLMVVLSDKTYTGKQERNPKTKAHKVDNVTNALNFCWACGVQMRLKPQPRDLVEENDKAVSEEFVHRVFRTNR